MATNREQIRDALVALLSTALVGAGLPCSQVIGYKLDTLMENTPAVVVHSAGTTREAITFKGNRPIFDFKIQVWVQINAAAQAIDALDLIESLIAATLETNRCTATWDLIQYTAPSTVSDLPVTGVPFYSEEFSVRVYLTQS